MYSQRKTYQYDKQLEIEIPSGFTQMDKVDIVNTFSSGIKPDYAYKSSDGKACSLWCIFVCQSIKPC